MTRTRTASSRLDERIGEVERRLRELRRSRKALERGVLRTAGPARPVGSAAPPEAAALRNEDPVAADRRIAPYASEEERRRFARYLPSAGFDAGAGGRAGGRVRRKRMIRVAAALTFLLFLLYRAIF